LKLGRTTAAVAESAMQSNDVLQLLRDYESQNVTYIASDGTWPVVWQRARGVRVWDADGRTYVDWTSAFGVAAAGHANRRVMQAGCRQMLRLPHAMGDVHPHELKALLARELSRVTFERWSRMEPDTSKRPAGVVSGKTIFCNSGFEAVEVALKTALLGTGRKQVLAFEGAYHGLGYGALNATHRHHFRAPFERQLGLFCQFLPFPLETGDLTSLERRITRLLRGGNVGAVLVEPVQGRGGIRVPPLDFLPMLRRCCDAAGAWLIVDEIYTGFGRTGRWFACEHSGVVPDLICLGKGLTGGFPLSACVGRTEWMDAAWPKSGGEAIHTSTYLGHPVGCAMALAQIEEIRSRKLCERAARYGIVLLEGLRRLETKRGAVKVQARGMGLMAGLELTSRSGAPAGEVVQRVIMALLRRGFILLPEGDAGEVIGLTPPLIISRLEINRLLDALRLEIGRVNR
jgi:4-aminobutyrate aminotransferase-like enzyme